MSETNKSEIGPITWTDLTIPNAGAFKSFCSEVVGWKSEPESPDD